MLRIKVTFILLVILLSSSLVAFANGTISKDKIEYEIANKEKEYAFSLVPEFDEVLSGRGYVPTLNFNYIRWKYRNEMRKYPDNPFLDFCMGELYRYKNKYEETFKHFDIAIRKAEENVFKHTILLNLFSQRRLHQWQMVEEEKFIELQKDFGALSLPLLSTYFFIRGREAAKTGLDDKIEKNIRISKELNPYNLGIRVFYIRFLFLNRRFDFFDEFLSLFHIMFLDFKTRLLFSIFTYNFLFSFIAFALAAFAIGFFIKYFSFVVSKITNVIPQKLPMSFRHFASISLVLLPIIWMIPSFYAFIFILIIPIPFLERKERWVVQSFILLLFIISSFGWFQTRANPAMDPTQRIGILDNMQKSQFNQEYIIKSDSLLSFSEKDFSFNYLKGLQLKRGGFLVEAEENYRRAININPNFYHTYNNLGNVYFWKGEIDSSIKYYDLALKYNPKASASHYNLSQAYVRKLIFDKSSHHMAIASQLDFNVISKQIKNSKEKNNRFLIDLALPEEMLWMEFFALEEDNSIFPWKVVGLNYRIFSALLIVFFLLFIIIPRIISGVKSQCPICSSAISKGNSKVFQNVIICWRCCKKLSTINSVDIQERLKDKINMDTRLRVGYTAVFWGLFLPGLGHLQIGKIRTGVLYILSFSILLTILIINRITEFSFYLPFSRGTSFGIYINIILIVFLYLFSLISLFASAFETRK